MVGLNALGAGFVTYTLDVRIGRPRPARTGPQHGADRVNDGLVGSGEHASFDARAERQPLAFFAEGSRVHQGSQEGEAAS